MKTLLLASFVFIVSCEALILPAPDCDDVCKHQHRYTDQQVIDCSCHHIHHQHQAAILADTSTTAAQTTTPVPTTTTVRPTTADICDYLCAIQAGGSACDCSVAIVPGRK